MNQLMSYKELPIWTQQTIPEGFKRQHNTKAGTWAKLTVLQGEVNFAMLDDAGKVLSEHVFSPALQPPFIEPQAWHKIVSVSDDVQCQLSFYCQPQDYFNKKYQLSPTHSEILAAAPYLQGGRALDVGCGEGRNSLYLNQQGYQVDAWDVNPLSLQNLHEIITAESIEHIDVQQRDLNADQSITGAYDFICCTVVMMFLEAKTVKPLIQQMQKATNINGYNLIVCAMDTSDIPAQPDFPFTFKAGELSALYEGWNIVKYNENVGELHRVDEQGNRIKQHFATLLAQKV
ncbi:SAM-dependent methyltransferase TehB [Acinetobacter gandensis]|uniref:Tellurite resistance methyltransferase TehB n=1 Tax=Acinetobacter gandensis TaxID=1443941 RepID=A0A1A7RCP4_9GAMM|nr:SAM-dependent methyltransferase TehB [Acinetobacter gandensis]KAB0628357.1 SAM-dependent methyltransferase TehB [Acinetobacter gandensis]OBX30025.1 tellurite resistance methyltransferase TehB [Acinetobacter gandensis]